MLTLKRVSSLAGGLNAEEEGGQRVAGGRRDAGGGPLRVERSCLGGAEVDAGAGNRTEEVVGLVVDAGLDGMAADDLGEVAAELVSIGDLRGLEVVPTGRGVVGDRDLGRQGVGCAEEAGDELRGETGGGELGAEVLRCIHVHRGDGGIAEVAPEGEIKDSRRAEDVSLVHGNVPRLDKRGVERAGVAGGAADGLVGVGDAAEEIVLGAEGLVDPAGVVVRLNDSLGVVVEVSTACAGDDRACRGEQGLRIQSRDGRDEACGNLVIRERGARVAIVECIKGSSERIVELNEEALGIA